MRHIVALRGDPAPASARATSRIPAAMRKTCDLVAGIKEIGDFEVSVSAYPEKHPEAASLEADIDALKRKVDAGADRAITQFFFDNDLYLRYVDARASARASTSRSCRASCRCRISSRRRISPRAPAPACRTGWRHRFEGLDQDVDTRKLIAAAVAAEQVLDLVDRGVTDFHFYTMNRADLVYAVCHLLGLRPQPRVEPERERAAA